jgi:hypothetical protein
MPRSRPEPPALPTPAAGDRYLTYGIEILRGFQAAVAYRISATLMAAASMSDYCIALQHFLYAALQGIDQS